MTNKQLHVHLHVNRRSNRTKDCGGLVAAESSYDSVSSQELDVPHFVTDFVQEYKERDKMKEELASRSTEHLQKAWILLQQHPNQAAATMLVRQLVKEELDKREMPKL